MEEIENGYWWAIPPARWTDDEPTIIEIYDNEIVCMGWEPMVDIEGWTFMCKIEEPYARSKKTGRKLTRLPEIRKRVEENDIEWVTEIYP